MQIKRWPRDGLRGPPRYSGLPVVIAFTAYVHPYVRKKCLEAGMDDYIVKPVKKEELEAILMKYSGEPAPKAVYVKLVRKSYLSAP